MSQEFELFKGTNFSDLMRDVYHNSKKKSRQIDTLIKELQPLIKNSGDATIIVPLIKEYLEASVKNDEHLVKMAAIVQRAMARSTQAEGKGAILTEEEKKQLIEVAQELEDREKNG